MLVRDMKSSFNILKGDIVLWNNPDIDWGKIPVLILSKPIEHDLLTIHGLALKRAEGTAGPRRRVRNYDTLGDFIKHYPEYELKDKVNLPLDMKVYDVRSWMIKHIIKKLSNKDIKIFSLSHEYN